jgi:hypothetical protein
MNFLRFLKYTYSFNSKPLNTGFLAYSKKFLTFFRFIREKYNNSGVSLHCTWAFHLTILITNKFNEGTAISIVH